MRSIGLWAGLLLVLAGCIGRTPPLPPLPEVAVEETNYRLAPGDAIRLDVFDVAALSGEFRLDGAGHIVVPLIGSVAAGDLTPADLASTVTARLSEKYLKNPDVTVRVQDYRRIFVLGEVARPGDFSFTSAMTVLAAVAKAGGFSYRADRADLVVTRAGIRYRGRPSSLVQPGDTIEVGERYF